MAMSDSFSIGKTATTLQVVTCVYIRIYIRLYVNTYSPVLGDCGPGSGPPTQRSLGILQTHRKR